MLREYRLNQTKLEDLFWNHYVEIIRKNTIPYQYRVLDNDPSVLIDNENRIGNFQDKRSNALENLRITAGISEGERYGTIFQDSDVYKWLEAVAYSLTLQPDADLTALADSVVDLIAAAQREDGYIDSYFQVTEPRMVYRMMYYGHELYCMGHLLEALTAYYEAVGSETAMEIARKLVKHLDATFGYEEGKIPGADGHQEIEIGLLKYYELTGDSAAQKLAAFFLDVRGKDPQFYTKQMEKNKEEGLHMRYAEIAGDTVYLQAHKQPKDQRTAEGHAVRMLYMAAAMARLVRHNQDPEMLTACRAIWKNVTERRMYVTAGVGSTVQGEAFSGDYDLPNESMYCETCASIALVYFAYEMFKMDPRAEYMDVIERALYNGILAGASDDGVHFFYVNPLEVHAAIAAHNPDLGHVKHIRPSWYSCACCPPNFARTIGSMQRYIYTEDAEGNTVYLNLWTDSVLKTDEMKISVSGCDLEAGRIIFHVDASTVKTLKIRIPYWTKNTRMKIGGAETEFHMVDGYAVLAIPVGATEIAVDFETPILAVTADPRVTAAANRLAVQRGPFVYCAEQIDNADPITEIRVSGDAIRKAEPGIGVAQMADCMKIRVRGRVRKAGVGSLYRFDEESAEEAADLTMIPYYRWANRGSEDMMVWIHRM